MASRQRYRSCTWFQARGSNRPKSGCTSDSAPGHHRFHHCLPSSTCTRLTRIACGLRLLPVTMIKGTFGLTSKSHKANFTVFFFFFSKFELPQRKPWSVALARERRCRRREDIGRRLASLNGIERTRPVTSGVPLGLTR